MIQVQGKEKQAGQPQKEQSAPAEDETEKVGLKNGWQSPSRSAAEAAVRHRPEADELSSYPASLRSAEDQTEFERPLIGPAAARSIKETALLEFLESPVILNIQPDERKSGIDGSEDASALAWRAGTVISILTLGWLASHQWHLQIVSKRSCSPRRP